MKEAVLSRALAERALIRRILIGCILGGCVVVGSVLTGCDWTAASSTDPNAPTDEEGVEIVEVRVSPESLQPGDVATFTCLTESSTNAGLQFRWYLDGIPSVTPTDVNRVNWTAPEAEGIYTHVVVAESAGGVLEPATLEFTVRVEREPLTSSRQKRNVSE